MHWVSCHSGKLLTSATKEESSHGFRLRLPAWDEIAPEKGLARKAIHELLHEPTEPAPLFVSLVLAKLAVQENGRRYTQMNADNYPRLSAFICGDSPAVSAPIVICDPERQVYPPAIASMGIPLNQVFLIHPASPADELWAMTESLRCKGIGAVIAAPRRLDRTQARRLQLAAEIGGGIGIFLRPLDRNAEIYSAMTRWLVKPAPGERAVQKWRIQLLHGHGGQVGSSFILERNRETHLVRAAAEFSNRSVEANLRLASG